jgi:HSP20 family protein
MDSDKNNLPKLFDNSFYDFMKSVDSFFDESFRRLNTFINRNTFLVDLYETKSDVVIEAELPGYKRDQIQVEILGNQLRIAVENSEITEEKNDENIYYLKKRPLQKVERFISLPFSISEKDTRATYQDGILRIVTPKRNISRRFIDIE